MWLSSMLTVSGYDRLPPCAAVCQWFDDLFRILWQEDGSLWTAGEHLKWQVQALGWPSVSWRDAVERGWLQSWEQHSSAIIYSIAALGFHVFQHSENCLCRTYLLFWPWPCVSRPSTNKHSGKNNTKTSTNRPIGPSIYYWLLGIFHEFIPENKHTSPLSTISRKCFVENVQLLIWNVCKMNTQKSPRNTYTF